MAIAHSPALPPALPQESLARRAMKGSLWSLIANGGQQGIAFLFFIYLAHVLGPAAFGIMAMAVVAIDVLSVVGRFGQVEALVQRATLSEALQSRIFWILQGIGLAFTVVIMLVAEPLAGWFRTPVLSSALLWLAPICLLQTLSAVHEARLRRTFGYKALAVRTLLGVLVGGVAGVVFATLHMGVYSLIFQRLANQIAMLGLLWAADGWRPNSPTTEAGESVRPMFKLGFDVAAANLVTLANTRLIDVLVGFFMGPVPLGYLRIAWRVYDFVMQFSIAPVITVALATFSRVQHDPVRLRNAYKRMSELASLGVFPVFFGMAAVAPVMVPLVFGRTWGPSIVLLQLLSPIAVAATINYFFVPLLTAVGQTRWVLWQGVAQFALSVLLTGLAAQWHIEAVVMAHVLRASLMSVAFLWIIQKVVGVSPRVTLGGIAPAVCCAGVMAVSVWLAWREVLHGAVNWCVLLGLAALGAVIYGGLLLVFFRPLVRRVWDTVLPLLRRRAESV